MLLLRTLGWLACVVYSTVPLFWLMVHPRAHRWREKKRSPFRVLVPAWMTMWVGIGAITGSWRRVTLYTTAWSWIPAVFLFTLGIFLYSRSGAHFSLAQLGGLPEVRLEHTDDRLITTGIRARVRHPVYLAHLCEMLAWSAGTGLVVCWVLTAFAIATGAVMIRMEDVELEERFGEKFRKYRNTVPAILPRLQETRSKGPKLSCDGVVILYEFQDREVWRIPISELVCVGEYTNANGPWMDDYFLVFGLRSGAWHEASFYSDGQEEAVQTIGSIIGCDFRFGFIRSTTLATRILWPKKLEGQPLFVDKNLNPDLKGQIESRQL